ncbi:MAG TPA: MFS transporter [Ktedonobacterales bacterium]|nr:MFS transporter [Ktedonobacterales bacterium]
MTLQTMWLRSILLSTALLDELTFGFLVVGLPLARDAFGMSYEQVGLLFTVGALSALVIEPGINLTSDHISKRVPILGGMFALVCAFALAGLTRNYALLLLAVALADPAIGAAVGLAQAALVEQQPAIATRILARWTLLSSVGDLLSPLVVAATAALGGGWTALSFVGASLWLAAGCLTLPLRFPRPALAPPSDDDEADGSFWATLWPSVRAALRDKTLLRWMGILVMATMVDEIFLGFTGLLLRDRLHATIASVSLILALGMVGGIVGLFGLERILARAPEQQAIGVRLLPWLALMTLVGIVTLLLAQALWLAAVALFVIGLGAMGWYPVARAATYDRLPGRAGLARAITGLVMPLELMLPALVGLLAERFSLVIALGFLGLAPVGVLLLAPRVRSKAATVSRETAL